jgi:GNAT superfamily N-acetyltransferase
VAGWRAAYVGLLDADFLASYAVEEDRVARRESWLVEAPPGNVTLVAEVSGALLGMAMLVPCRDDDLPDAAELAALYVEPRHRYTGVGSALLRGGFARMPQPLQVLWVLEGNEAARQFYERHGFVADGARKLLEMPGAPPEVRYRRTDLG